MSTSQAPKQYRGPGRPPRKRSELEVDTDTSFDENSSSKRNKISSTKSATTYEYDEEQKFGIKRPRGRPPLSTRSCGRPLSDFEFQMPSFGHISGPTIQSVTTPANITKAKPPTIKVVTQKVLNCLMTENPLTVDGLKNFIPETTVDTIISVLEVLLVMGIVIQVFKDKKLKTEVMLSDSSSNITSITIDRSETSNINQEKPNPAIGVESDQQDSAATGPCGHVCVTVTNQESSSGNSNSAVSAEDTYYTMVGHARVVEPVDFRNILEEGEKKKREIEIIKMRVDKLRDFATNLQNNSSQNDENNRRKQFKKFFSKLIQDSDSLRCRSGAQAIGGEGLGTSRSEISLRESDPLYAVIADACGFPRTNRTFKL